VRSAGSKEPLDHGHVTEHSRCMEGRPPALIGFIGISRRQELVDRTEIADRRCADEGRD
jgi:hypothetical protein